MDNILYVLLLPTIFGLRIANSEDLCNEDNCNSTEAEAAYADEIENDLFTLDSDLSELHMDGCSYLSGILEVTPNLRILDIFNCSWYSINITELSGAPQLSTLRMRGGRLLKLNSNQFVELPQLEVLELGTNRIRIVSKDTFVGLSQLWMLALNDNYLRALQENLFYPLPELRHLDLSNNRLNGLPEGIFAKNPKLQVLYLRRAYLLNLSPKTLIPVRNLLVLDLSNNYCRDLQLAGAESMRLENIGMQSLRIDGKVSKLQAGNNHLENLDIRNKDAVIELDVSENSLDSYVTSYILQGMWRLQSLDISQNLLKELPIFPNEHSGEVFLLPSLRFVNMSKNLLKHLLANSPLLCPSLTHLDVSYNKIRSLEPDSFSMASNIESLHIQGNLLVYFQYEVFHHQQRGLKEVALYNNDFRRDIYEKIIKYFANAGVLVLEENEEAALKTNASNIEAFHTGMLIRQLPPIKKGYEPARRQTADQNIFKKWSTWNILILLSLLAVMTINVILILKHLRSSGRRVWRRKHTPKIKVSFLKRKSYKI